MKISALEILERRNQETSILDLSMKLFAVASIPALKTNAITSDFLSSIFPGWVVMFLHSPRTVFTFHSWKDLLSVVLTVWISILKIFKSLQYILHRVSGITSFEQHLESSSGHTKSFCPNMVQYRFKSKRKRSDSVLWQKPLHQQKCQKGKVTTQTTPQKSSIKQRLRTDLGRSVGVATATQLVWLTGLRAHLPTNRNSRLIKRTHV